MDQASGQSMASASNSATESPASGNANPANRSGRPSASVLALTLRRMAREKADHLDRWRKTRPAHWIEMYEHDVLVLGWAAVGYEKLAERESA